MSYTHNERAEYRDNALEAQEEFVETQKEFVKLFGASGLSVLAAACGSDDDDNPNPNPVVDDANDYYKIIGQSKSRGWKHLSIWAERDPNDVNVWMNYGTSGGQPLSVLRTLSRYHKTNAENPAGPWDFKVSVADARGYAAASMFGCLPQEFVFTFNTTDGMCRIVSGIQWQSGDVVLITNNEHSGGLGPLYHAWDRYNLKVFEVNVPTGISKGPGTGGYVEAEDGGELVARFEAARIAAGGTVKAIMISSPPYTLGWRLQEKQLCEWAYKHGIISIIDAAHIPGAQPVNLHDMGCDFFAGTAAKWQCAPGQTGWAYIRQGKAGDPTSSSFNSGSFTSSAWTNTMGIPDFFINATGYTHFASSKGYQGKWKLADDIGGSITGEYGVGNPNWPTIRICHDVNKVWQQIGRSAIAKYDQSLSQYLRQMLANSPQGGEYTLGVDYRTPKGVIPTGAQNHKWGDFPVMLQTGLTSFRPWGVNKDYNDAVVDWQKEVDTQVAAMNRLQYEYGIRVRNSDCKQQLRATPELCGRSVDTNGTALPVAERTTSRPFRVSTHLYTTVEEVERCVKGLENILAGN